jgi:menaquinol-cytochrome c reductase iron-sulfur subunit
MPSFTPSLFHLFTHSFRMERRSFLARIVQFFSALITGLFALPVFSFIRASFGSDNMESSYPVGNIQAAQDEITRMHFTRLIRDGWMVRSAQEYVWVRKKPDGTIVVFEPHCTHLGCAYDWDSKVQQFLCPCHGGKFDKDGNRIAGPPPRELDRFDVKVVGDQIRIGKLRKA